MFQTSEKNSSHRSPPVMHRRVGFGEIACLQSVLDRQSPTSSVVHLGGVKSPLATGQSIVRHSSHQRPFFFNATRWALRAFLSRFFSPNRGENKKCLKPPPRYVYTWTFKSGCQMVPLQGGNQPQSVRVDNWHPFEDAGMSVCV